jgi:hypothetical protein
MSRNMRTALAANAIIKVPRGVLDLASARAVSS